MKGCFEYGKFSVMLSHVSEMKKTDFEKQYKNTVDVKSAWIELQKELKRVKDEERKK